MPYTKAYQAFEAVNEVVERAIARGDFITDEQFEANTKKFAENKGLFDRAEAAALAKFGVPAKNTHAA